VATYFLDPEGGNDANDGLSFANRWQTFTLGATAARIAPGDTIRVKASPLPTSLGNATWANGSPDVTLAGAVTANISLCNSAWTDMSGGNVTCTTSGTNKEGASSASMAIAAGFTTGAVAFFATGTLDLSAYQQVSFWIRTVSGTLAASTLELQLCSDVAGATPVTTIPIPALVAARWTPITVDTGGALPASIKSVRLNALLDPGTVTILIDNILACKAPGSADSLTLHSMIGKKNGTEPFHAIKSINGTTVRLEYAAQQSATGTRNYQGTSETVTTYKRETFQITPKTLAADVVNAINDSGTEASPIVFSGGWNRTDMSTQESGEDGESWFDGQIGHGYAFDFTGKSWIQMERFGAARMDTGIQCANSATGGPLIFTTMKFSAFNTVWVVGSLTAMKFTGLYGFGCSGSTGVNVGNCADFEVNGAQFDGCGFYGFLLNGCTFHGNSIKSRGSSERGLFVTNGPKGFIRDLTTANNTNSSIHLNNSNCILGFLDLINASMAEAIEVSDAGGTKAGYLIRSQQHDGGANAHRHFMFGGQVNSETAVRHTASGLAWKLSPTSAERSSEFPVKLTLARIAVAAGTLLTVKAWFRRDNTGITAKLVIPKWQISGLTADVTATISVGANTWEELTVMHTPAEAGVIEVEAWAYGGTTFNAYVDDMTISQA
jgi:hypothetical protein